MAEFNNLVESLSKHKTLPFPISDLDLYDLETFNTFIDKIFGVIYNTQGRVGTCKNYKLSYYEHIIEILVELIFMHPLKKEIFETKDMEKILLVLSLTIHGHKYLNKLKDNIIKMNITEKEVLLASSASRGGFPTFLFWANHFNIDILKDENKYLFQISIKNSDNRLFKWTIHKIKADKSMLLHNTDVIQTLISEIFCSTIPAKFKLKRIKYLSQNCNLVPYFGYMLEQYPSYELTKCLFKYYYQTPLSYTNINFLSSICANELTDITVSNIYNIFITDTEKAMFIICNIIKYNNSYNLTDKLQTLKIDINIILMDFTYIIDALNQVIQHSYYNWNNLSHKIDNIAQLYNLETKTDEKALKYVLDLFSKHNLWHDFSYLYIKHYIKHYNTQTSLYFDTISPILLLFFKCVPVTSLINISINRLLSFLRVVAKKQIKSKKIHFQIKYFPVFQELLNFKPSEKPVLCNGSYNWQIQQHKFTHVPPRHLLPFELEIYDTFLLREKADGILINNLTSNIYPKCVELITNHIKAEYIESLEVYLVFDININHNIIERYNYLRSLHPYTKDTKLEMVNTVEELIQFINNERIIFNKFLDESKDHQIKWYPKVAFHVISPASIKYQLVNNSKLFDFINNDGMYKCDGLILSPLKNNSSQKTLRDIKIKPSNMFTIDLLWNGKHWLDKEKNSYNSIISICDDLKVNKIYRCYPIAEGLYNPIDIRYDKKYPNNFDVINMIQTLYKYNWKENIKPPSMYYQIKNPKLTSIYVKFMEEQNMIFNTNIEKLTPELNKTWLDLGCGKLKLINMIKKYNPKKYIGIDNDINILLPNSTIIDNIDWVKLCLCDLQKNWFENSIWYNIKNMTFDYIILNYSIMHMFKSEEFWTCLQSVCHPHTKILFNVVSEKIKITEFKLGDAYMNYSDDKVIYYFPWAHKSEMSEDFIKKSDIDKQINKYGFVINNIYNHDFYDWYEIRKN